MSRENQLGRQLCGYPDKHGPHGVGIYHCDGIPLPPLPDSAHSPDATEPPPSEETS